MKNTFRLTIFILLVLPVSNIAVLPIKHDLQEMIGL